MSIELKQVVLKGGKYDGMHNICSGNTVCVDDEEIYVRETEGTDIFIPAIELVSRISEEQRNQEIQAITEQDLPEIRKIPFYRLNAYNELMKRNQI